ncbi:MAG: galactokinase [Actinomycetota bacterium]
MDAGHRAARLFREQFGADPDALLRAPARVNLIGEHTDYNDGFVLPAAIDRDLCVAIRPRPDPRVDVRSEGHGGAVVALESFGRRSDGWGVYVQGVAWALTEAGHSLAGWDGAIASDIPIGAGLSSSAAIELATARAFELTSGFAWDSTAIARLCQRAENEWVGLASGLMDQLACVRGRRGHAILLDCRSLRSERVPIPDRAAIVILDTGTRRELETSAYNDRRRECEAAARALGVGSLRDASESDLRSRSSELAGTLERRARHVITENARTLAAADAMRAGDAELVGTLMDESHRSLRDDFEVSSRALDAIAEAARSAEGCFGARLTGGGFAGCAVALVERSRTGEFEPAVRGAYGQATGLECEIFVCRASDGVSALPVPDDGP